MPGKPLPTIAQAEVARHNNSKSCYVTIGSYVYDVTSFLEDHPGGGDLILEHAGLDVAEIMKDEISHLHSEAAYEILQERIVGFVATDAILETVTNSDEPHSIVPLPPTKAGMDLLKADGTAGDLIGNDIAAQTGVHHEEDANQKYLQDLGNNPRKPFIDINKPMLIQVWNGGFSKEYYLEQVHKATHYQHGPSAPLFGSPFLEPLSKTPWWLIPLLWLPCLARGLMLANAGLSSPIETATYFLLGLGLWTLVEYGMHRGLFHVDKYLPDNRVGVTAHFLLHGIHHFLPMDRYRLVMPPVLLVFLTVPFYQLAHTVFYWDWYVAMAVFCGGFFGYIGYDLTHYFLHHKKLPSYYQTLKKYHLAHHYQNYENGFGVTSRFWDKVFGTELVVPAKAAKAA